MIHHGDCLTVMGEMEPESIDAIVCDPPYGLEFMGKEWDKLGIKGVDRRQPGDPTFHASGAGPFDRAKVRYGYGQGISVAQQDWHAKWAAAALRVAKPGAYLLAFGGTRTVHRMTCAIEDAGWTIRDVLVWGYAQGFPKSKASLKPAWEPIVMARKPGRSTELQIDAARIGTTRDVPASLSKNKLPHVYGGSMIGQPSDLDPDRGRWPANIVLTDPIFDGGVDGVVGGGESDGSTRGPNATAWLENADATFHARGGEGYGDTGTYSRFFLVPKASRGDREPVMSDLPVREQAATYGDIGPVDGNPRKPATGHVSRRQNTHPTVKPLDLMRHLVRLVTPPGGTVLDPFLGSGTTAIAAEMEGFAWQGIEREAEYVAIAEARLAWVQRGLGLDAA